MSEQNKIDEIKAVLAAATPGPWYAEDHKDGTYSVTGKPGYYGHCITGWGRVRQNKGDAEFIAKAPEYITYLLQEIERKDEALRFYADDNNYSVDIPSSYEPVILDCGQRAREAL